MSEPITCRMKFTGLQFYFYGFTTKTPVKVENGQFMDFVELSALEAAQREIAELKEDFDKASDLSYNEMRKAQMEIAELKSVILEMSKSFSAIHDLSAHMKTAARVFDCEEKSEVV